MVIRKMTRTKVEILLKHVLPVYSLAEIGVGTDPMIPGFLNVKIDFWLFNVNRQIFMHIDHQNKFNNILKLYRNERRMKQQWL
jgi:hypothetical protein